MYKIIKFNDEEQYINDFLALPTLIYDKNNITQNIKDEKKILLNTHSLSKYFKTLKYLCYDSKDKVIARAIVTLYPDKNEAYIGFFEAFDNKEAVKELLKKIENELEENSIDRIVGPIDSSFWIKYRLKIDNFNEELYIGEPYNEEYYYNLFIDNGYSLYKTWTSNIYEIKDKNYEPEKYKERYNQFTKKGYKIVSPRTKKEFEDSFKIAYKLIMELYKDFPIFKNISEDDYYKYFSFYRVISNYRFLKIAYYDDEPVGFFIGIPNYKNLLYGKMSFILKLKIMFLRKYSKSFVAQYIGVKKEHRGLGKAIIYTVLQEAKKCKGKIIGALIEEDKETEKYFDDAVTNKYHYVLLEKKLGD